MYWQRGQKGIKVIDLQEQGAKSYRSEIRGVTRGYWTGVYSYEQAFSLMMFNIRAGLTSAWHNGLKEVGLLPSDMTPAESIQLEQVINSEFAHIDGFLTFIEQNSKANGGKLGSLWPRANMWINRYKDVQNQAKQTAQNDPVLTWQLGPTEEHCGSCSKLAGKTKRASTWQRSGIRPQSQELECKGYNCLCVLEPTPGQPLSRGPLPRI